MLRRSSCMAILMVFSLIAVALYMVFAFPYTVMHLKQSETTEIKSVIIVARAGEKTPSFDSYFAGEFPPSELLETIGTEQLTNNGKQRMFAVGKLLKLKYYQLLLNGNPRFVFAQTADIDRYLESAQVLLAGLNPAKDQWSWSDANNELNNWQPIAVHTTETKYDDMLTPDTSNCPRLESEKAAWKNSTKYQSLLKEYRHDMDLLRTNTGLEFEDDLEMLYNIEESLKTRRAFAPDDSHLPEWYSAAFSERMAHIAYETAASRYSSPDVQRLLAGRLLHEISESMEAKIRAHKQRLLTSRMAKGGRGRTGSRPKRSIHRRTHRLASDTGQPSSQQGPSTQPLRRKLTATLASRYDTKVQLYLTSKQRLLALMKSLGVYMGEPNFGAVFLIELHYDPINSSHFVRFYSVDPRSDPNILPEPLRVNPIACGETVECDPTQFRQNLRHIMMDQLSWHEACLNTNLPEATTDAARSEELTRPPSTMVPSFQSTLVATTTRFDKTTPTAKPTSAIDIITTSTVATKTDSDSSKEQGTLDINFATTTNGQTESSGQESTVTTADTAPVATSAPIVDLQALNETVLIDSHTATGKNKTLADGPTSVSSSGGDIETHSPTVMHPTIEAITSASGILRTTMANPFNESVRKILEPKSEPGNAIVLDILPGLDDRHDHERFA